MDDGDNPGHDSPSFEMLPDRKPVVLHPLRAFPSRNDTITKSFFGSSVNSHKAKVVRTKRWLDPLKIDPKFGVEGNSQEDEIRRAFRRIESSTLFVPASKDRVSLAELSAANESLQSASFASPGQKRSRSAVALAREIRGGKDDFKFSESHNDSWFSPSASVASSGAAAMPSMYSTAPADLMSIGATTTAAGSGVNAKRSLVVVEASQLKELSRFETILRDERYRLGEQCSMILAGLQVSPHIPLPATRLALQNVCEGEMRTCAAKIAKLNAQWREFSKMHHYDKPHLYRDKDDSFFLKHGPLDQRAFKLKLAREAVDNWRLSKDRDTMSYEDDLSHLCERYLDAQIRRRDYDRYYILATRYGRYTEEEFNRDSRPGRRYWVKVWRGAVKFQRLWDRYWAVTKLRRHRAARMIQKYFRRHLAMKFYVPLIRIRRYFGKRAYFVWYFRMWQDYIELVKRAREIVIAMKNVTYVPKVFTAWKKITPEFKVMRIAREKKANERAKNGLLYARFSKWVRFLKRKREAKRRLYKLIKFPQFGDWVRYTKMCIQSRRLRKAAMKLTSLVRCIRRYRRRKLEHKSAVNITYLFRIAKAKKIKKIKRDIDIEKEFTVWKPKELVRRAAKQREREVTRQEREQQAIKEREKKERAALKKFLTEESGRIQLNEIAAEKAKAFGGSQSIGSAILGNLGLSTGNRDNLIREARSELIEKCNTLVRSLEKHDFRVEQSPFICCPSPFCGACCASEEQYLNHFLHAESHAHPGFTLSGSGTALAEAPAAKANTGFGFGFRSSSHKGSSSHKASPAAHENEHPVATGKNRSAIPMGREDFSHLVNLNVMLRYPKGIELFRSHVAERHGMGHLTNVLEAWLAIQDWKKTPSTQDAYHSKAMNILSTYLQHSGSRELKTLNNNLAGYSDLVATLTKLKQREYVGFYQGAHATVSLLRKMTGMQGKFYEKWTDEQIVPPGVFDELEWQCLVTLYKVYSESFPGSKEDEMYIAFQHSEDQERDARLMKDYLKVRKARFMTLAREVKRIDAEERREKLRIETETEALALKVADSVHHREVNRISEECIKRGVAEEAFEIRCEEQLLVEYLKAMTDEVYDWVEDRCINDCYEFYTKALLRTMWEKPEMQDPLLEFAGFKKPDFKKALAAQMQMQMLGGHGATHHQQKKKKEEDEWVSKFVSTTTNEELQSLPLTQSTAAVRIQKRIRGVLGRKQVRKVFVGMYAKRFDPTTKMYFYVNNKTNETSWERPRLFGRLFPKSTW